MFNKIKDVVVSVSSAGALALASSSANAASEFPSTLAAGFATDFGDTVDEMKLWLIGLIFVIGLAMFAVNITRKALGKVGGA